MAKASTALFPWMILDTWRAFSGEIRTFFVYALISIFLALSFEAIPSYGNSPLEYFFRRETFFPFHL
jgi:hypothetical protein